MSTSCLCIIGLCGAGVWMVNALARFSGFSPLAEALISWSDFIDDRYDNSSPSRSALCRMNCRIFGLLVNDS